MVKVSLAFVLISSLFTALNWAEAPKATAATVATLPLKGMEKLDSTARTTPVAKTDTVPVTTPAPMTTVIDSPKAVSAVVAQPKVETVVPEAPVLEPQRQAPDYRLFNDRPLLVNEYGFGILGSVVAGALSFYIGSGIESAIYGSDAHKGTLKFSGIRYDNHFGAFYGGATGIILGSALTTYFVGQTDEEEGAFFPTLLGTTLATGGALAVASWMGVNDEINWTPFIPLLALPSLGGVLGFNVSRLFMDHKREKIVGQQSSIHLFAPRLGWMKNSSGGNLLLVQALNLRF
jgi:hypothetical protein